LADSPKSKTVIDKGGQLLATWSLKAMRPWLFGALAATAIGTGLATTQYRPVDIRVYSPAGTRTLKFWTFRSKVRNILAQAKIPASARDVVKVKTSSAGTKSIAIREAIPVWVRTAHHHFKYWTTDYHVGSVLSALGIKLGPLDKVRPPLSDSIAAGMHVDVIRRWLETKTMTSSLPFSVTYRPDSNLASGNRQVLANGHKGLVATTVQYLVQNGAPLHNKVIAKKLIARPSPEVVAYGTAQPVTVNGQTRIVTQQIFMVSTAYWPDPAWSTGLTAMGTPAHYGVAAVDPAVIPLGSQLYIPGYGYAVAADTGSAIIGNRIDLCFNDQQQAVDWGVQPLEVDVLGN
jgi:3D (Asp-Asp-Asp) domain-containing protein